MDENTRRIVHTYLAMEDVNVNTEFDTMTFSLLNSIDLKYGEPPSSKEWFFFAKLHARLAPKSRKALR